jgi:hypothetical protein
MGLDHSPIIVTDGLVGYWDAANPRSYSGSGNTWYDLSRNANNLSLTNSPSYNSSGYFSTGSTGYFTGAGTSSIPNGSSPYTMSCIAQLPTWGSSRGIMSIGGFGSLNGSNAIRTGNTADLGHFFNYWWNNDLAITNNNGNTASSRWFSISATYDGTTRKIFVNSILVGSDTPTAPNVSSTTIQLAKTWNTEYLNGLISIAKIYNRALTASEIVQNYNATKRRYGL